MEYTLLVLAIAFVLRIEKGHFDGKVADRPINAELAHGNSCNNACLRVLPHKPVHSPVGKVGEVQKRLQKVCEEVNPDKGAQIYKEED